MKNKSRKIFSISLAAALLLSILFVFAANNKIGAAKFDIYLGAIWVFILSFIVILSLTHMFKR